MEDDELDQAERIIRIEGDIDEAMSKSVVKAIHAMVAEPGVITVDIHSDGGILEDGFRIIDALNVAKSRGSKIHTVVTGKAYSMAAIILCVGDTRTAYRNARLMFHSARYDGEEMVLTRRDLGDMHAEMSLYDSKFIDILRGLGVPEARISNFMDRDCYISAEEAIALHILDGIETEFV